MHVISQLGLKKGITYIKNCEVVAMTDNIEDCGQLAMLRAIAIEGQQ